MQWWNPDNTCSLINGLKILSLPARGCVCVCMCVCVCGCVVATRYHAIACSCAQTLIYWSVFQSTIVRLFACYTERNVNQCILNGSVLRQLTCSTKRYERERKREREGQRERERARERLQKGCAQIVQCTLVMFMPKPQMLYVYIYIYILPNYIYCLYICIGYIYN